MVDQLGRFGMAVAIIALLASGLYQFGGSVSFKEPGTVRSVFYSPH